MDRRFLTVLGVSLIFALIVSTVFYRMTASNGAQASKPENTDQREIVLASKPLSVGVTIKPADLKVSKVPADQFPKGAFSKIEEVIDRPVISNILLDEPVLAGRLADRGSGLGLAPIIPVGMRAATVRVTDVAGVAGFVLPGLRVDVLVTGRPPRGEETVTATCLQNILVLSAGQTMTPDSRGNAIQTPTVTLLVTPEQAETLTLANNDGRIQLILRNSSDQTVQQTPGSETNRLYGGRGAVRTAARDAEAKPRPRPKPVQVAAAPVAPPPPPPAPPEVIVIRGNTKTVEVVGNARTN